MRQPLRLVSRTAAVVALALAALSGTPALASTLGISVAPSPSSGSPWVVNQGDTLTVSVNLDVTSPFTLYSFSLNVQFDSAHFALQNVGAPSGGFSNVTTGNGTLLDGTWSGNGLIPTGGNTMNVTYSTSGAGIPLSTGQTGSLFTFMLKAIGAPGTYPNAVVVQTPDPSGVGTGVFSTTDPSNSQVTSGTSTDITINAVPEPFQLGMVGLLGGLGALKYLVGRRRRARA